VYEAAQQDNLKRNKEIYETAVALWHASRAEGEEAVVLLAHRGARVGAASPKLAALSAEGAKRASYEGSGYADLTPEGLQSGEGCENAGEPINILLFF
jgi:hypothetical protein